MALTAGLSLLTLLALQAAAQEPLYVEIGKNLNLDPKSSETITAITWKHKGNIAAEYIKDNVPLEYLGDLKGRLKLDVTTGILTISNITKSDDGQFTVEVNNRVLPVKFNVVGVKKLVTVEVILRPLTCESETHNCTLSCGEDFKDAEPVQYFWKTGETEEWKEGEKTIRIFSEEEKKLGLRTFTCKAKNKFSEKQSGPLVNPFKNKESSGLSGGAVAGIVIIIILLIVAGGFIYWKFIYVKKNEGFASPRQGDGVKANGDESRALNMPEPGKDANSEL
ncbi:carcinoembryonic antigen-related cell adhesion molecule 1-like isoform X1 [Xiphophorus couchianus]|uniref:Ig-like domain-containing protein n=1 Tax=Xiphophorus couchianus TaxID=32473 RepID=A0A3B5L8Y1_9TELE|nr:carcinoembryonic antigen-related cell adhesion molecule 1-like isoform X1 [Xiphophorus couchianus]